MNYLFLTNLYPPHEIGGYEQICEEVVNGLRGRGHVVTVLTSRYQKQNGGAETASKETTGEETAGEEKESHVIRSLYLDAPMNYYRPTDFFLRRPRQEAWNRDTLRQVIREVQPDVLLVWGMWNLSLNLPYWAEEWLPGRVAYYLCSYWPQDTDTHRLYWQLPTNRKLGELIKTPLRKLALTQLAHENYPPPLQFARTTCVSQYVRDRLVEAGKLPSHAGVLLTGIDTNKFVTLPASCAIGEGGGNAVSTHTLSEPQMSLPRRREGEDERVRLLYFGRLIADKGVHTALEAIAQLRERGLGSTLSLTILGGGHPDYEQRLREYVAQHQLAEMVNFVGSIPREQVPIWLAQHDIYLFTSIWPEPMARSVMEAMAAGLLVVGSNVGGQQEMLLEGQNALTFPLEDASRLADQLERAVRSPDLCNRLALAGQQLVLNRFTMTRMVDEMEAWLGQIAGEN